MAHSNVVPTPNESDAPDWDAIVVGAGFAGLYMLQRLREQGFSVLVVEAGPEVGGTWYWNRYPGLRCDIPTTDYSYTWDPELETEWEWSEKFATQPEILDYLRFVADRHDLRRDIRFGTRVDRNEWDEHASLWRVRTDGGEELRARHLVMATGALSVPKHVDIPGVEDFTGAIHSTCDWPVDGVDLSGKRVAVIGTGSSGIQVIPVLAEQAAELTVFQRTPAFTLPAKNGPAPAHRRRMLAEDRESYRDAARWSSGGVPMEPPSERAVDLTPEEQIARLEHAWNAGEIAEINSVFADHLTNKAANDIFADFLRQKIRSIVVDPRIADVLCPTDYPFMAKRPCFGTGYYEVFNEDHVRLVDLRQQPIVRITTSGLETSAESFDFDVIVFATGYDALTGALTAIDIVGRDGVVLRDKWQAGPSTYLGLTSAGFPNLFMITGPGSPSVLSNMVVSIEQHVDWVARCLHDLREGGFDVIEATPKAERGWVQHVNDCADVTLFPTANSWYVGANVPGKPRVFMPYVGGVGVYRATCEAVIEGGYLGFRLEGPAGSRTSDVVVNRLQPDVAELVREFDQHPAAEFHTMAVDEARKVVADFWRVRDPLPCEAAPAAGTVPAAGGALRYRLFRASLDEPRPLIAWISGAGWVFDDPTTETYCRDLAERTGCSVVAVEPPKPLEKPFPSAVEAVSMAVRWFAEHSVEIGGMPGRLVLAGWDSGANLAAGAAATLHDEGIDLTGCLFIDPIMELEKTAEYFAVDADGRWPEHPQLEWMIGQYVAAENRHLSTASPLRASLQGFPPTVIAVSELGTLRPQGEAFAQALVEAGSVAQLLVARGHSHGSLVRVDLLSGNSPRADIADAVRQLFDAADAREGSAVPGLRKAPVGA